MTQFAEEQEKTTTVKMGDWEHLNDVKPIWLRPPSEISEEEYNSFFKAITKETTDPLKYTHFSAEVSLLLLLLLVAMLGLLLLDV